MSKARSPTTGLAAIAAFVASPGLAALHETTGLPFSPAAPLWSIGIVVLAAALGMAVSLWVGRRDSWWLGAIAAFPNAAVLAFYGFLLLFFGLGGSR